MYIKNGKIYKLNTTDYVVTFLQCIALVVIITGYFMNFQNLWEYWPESGQFSDVPMRWIISTISIFLAPIGVFTGWIF